jgi:hypothetical protein
MRSSLLASVDNNNNQLRIHMKLNYLSLLKTRRSWGLLKLAYISKLLCAQFDLIIVILLIKCLGRVCTFRTQMHVYVTCC